MGSGMKYPRTVRELVDYDYADQLSEADRAFLEQFTEEYYGASFSDDSIHDDAQRRELYRVKNRRNQDIYGKSLRAGPPKEDWEDTERDWRATPEHLNSSEYQEALAEYRSHLPTDARRTVEVTPQYLETKQKLAQVADQIQETGYMPKPSKTKMDKLLKLRETILNIGIVVERHEFKGAEATAAVEMLKFLQTYLENVETKLKALDWVAPAVPNVKPRGIA